MVERTPFIDKLFFYGLLTAIVGMYIAGIGANSIWTTHESYYAVAVREMLERGTFWDITFNGDLRLNKPPMTYWLMAGSAGLFGLHEWSLRVPIVLLGLGTLLVVYHLGKLLYSRLVGLLAMMMMAVSLQFVWLKHYASPEIPLTFFFTLTIYWFVRAIHHPHRGTIALAYLSLGLTILTKGYPYFIIIGGILITYLFVHTNYSWRKVRTKLAALYVVPGSLLSLSLGMSWVMVMLYRYPQQMGQVLHFETTARVFENSNLEGSLRNIFFYPEVTLWSFLPYSLALYLVIFYYITHSEKIKEVALSLSWLAIMLVIFTVARGKLPAYFIEAHPAMALLLASFLVNYQPVHRIRRWQIAFLLPAFLLLVVGLVLVVLFHLSPVWYFVLLISSGLMMYGLTRLRWEQLPYYGFFAMYLTLLIMFTGMYPALERFRPYPAIHSAIQAEKIASSVPLVVQERFIHNLPYYAERKVLRDRVYSLADILQMGQQQEVLALIKTGYEAIPPGYKVLWEGSLYKRGSESHGFQFALACWQAMEGNTQKFQKYTLIYQPTATTYTETSNHHPPY